MGLAIQLSQGQNHQLFSPEGAPAPGACGSGVLLVTSSISDIVRCVFGCVKNIFVTLSNALRMGITSEYFVKYASVFLKGYVIYHPMTRKDRPCLCIQGCCRQVCIDCRATR